MALIDNKLIAITPILNYPQKVETGKSYLLTIDLKLPASPFEWPYKDEEYLITCLVDTLPLFENEYIGENTLILHRFGGTYGPVFFMLTTKPDSEAMEGVIKITFVNQSGLLVSTVFSEKIKLMESS